MITDFTLFHVQYIHPISNDLIYHGLMRAREAQRFIDSKQMEGIPTFVELAKKDATTGEWI